MTDVKAGSMLVLAGEQEVKNWLREVLVEEGLIVRRDETQLSPVHDEMPTRVVQKRLKEKGYRVSSVQALNGVLSSNGVKATRRGKDNWYKTVDIERIPNKI
ncbi:MAG: hypothetical protein KF744_09245 [Taibaiella sp.]|nr:hypothetical protein [Taibaiella sp.]